MILRRSITQEPGNEAIVHPDLVPGYRIAELCACDDFALKVSTWLESQ